MKPLLCNTQVVKNILAGLQTQDRRPMKPQPEYEKDGYYWWKGDWDTRGGPRAGVCTHGSRGNGGATWTLEEMSAYGRYQVGDVLYVRERTRYMGYDGQSQKRLFKYEADESWSKSLILPKRIKEIPNGHCCSNGCFKELARLFLKVTGVKNPERLCDISEADAIAEGLLVKCGDVHPGLTEYSCGDGFWTSKPVVAFHRLINLIYPGQWEDWCFPYKFERCEKNE